ncbi:cytochrome aa3 quinol oxidase subunit II [Metabacillus idriensis]|uniref:cytochrome aa3 quinol oxidase subunit II n=1 Tax=Metabacillus idriensis TaxID=324768 RepID=UPI001CD6A8AD|nr:cytochrome aa3 quinol oxidase subunit II [Metabacillus idriensis]
MFKLFKPLLALGLLLSVFLLGGCSELIVLDPKGPVAAAQSDLILLSIGFMLFILAVVFVLFTLIVVKYRERKDNMEYEPPEMEGSKFLEIVWTVIPILIVIALSIPTVQTIYALEEPPESSKDKAPLVIHATSVDWKWIFSYEEEGIETVNYLNIPEDRAVEFKLSSADTMTAFWIPQLGGQKYAMSGMQTKLFLQADEPGTYAGRNANFTGKGFEKHTFNVEAMPEDKYEDWVEKTKDSAPKLTQDQYDQLMLPGTTGKMTFSNTHLDWVDHSKDSEYAVRVREQSGYELNKHDEVEHLEKLDPNKEMNIDHSKKSESHSGHGSDEHGEGHSEQESEKQTEDHSEHESEKQTEDHSEHDSH